MVGREEGEVLGVRWRAWISESEASKARAGEQGKGDEKRHEEGGKGDFDVKVSSQAPGVWVDKVVPKGRTGSRGEAGGKKEGGEGQGEGEEEVDERSFLQK